MFDPADHPRRRRNPLFVAGTARGTSREICFSPDDSKRLRALSPVRDNERAEVSRP
jgi:galactose-1-phosphate uridylyltransferase